MDKEIKPKNRFLKKAAVAIAGAAIIAAAIYAITRIGDNTYKADADSVAIAEVTSGIFNDCIRLNGRVETGVTVQVSALETGIVDRRWVEEGAMVKEGDIILTLHNPNLRQQILDSESQLAEKQNMLRDTELAMEKERLQVRQDILSTRTDYSRKQRIMKQHEQLYREWILCGKVDSLLFESDNRAALACKFLKKKGVSIPDDFGIVGSDNDDVCDYCSPELTSIDDAQELQATYAIRMLLDMLNDKNNACIDRSVTVKSRLIIRESSRKCLFETSNIVQQNRIVC